MSARKSTAVCGGHRSGIGINAGLPARRVRTVPAIAADRAASPSRFSVSSWRGWGWGHRRHPQPPSLPGIVFERARLAPTSGVQPKLAPQPRGDCSRGWRAAAHPRTHRNCAQRTLRSIRRPSIERSTADRGAGLSAHTRDGHVRAPGPLTARAARPAREPRSPGRGRPGCLPRRRAGQTRRSRHTHRAHRGNRAS